MRRKMVEDKMKCYCINCREETELVTTNEDPINKKGEKKIYGYCKVCCEKMCLIKIV